MTRSPVATLVLNDPHGHAVVGRIAGEGGAVAGLQDRPALDVIRLSRRRTGDAAAADDLFPEGQLLGWGIPATSVLVQTLLDRGAESDVAGAEAAIERLATAPAEEDLVIRDILLLRLRALLARAFGDDARYREYRDRYRDMAKTLGFEGHIAWAEAMP